MSDIHQNVTNQILDGMSNQRSIPWRNSWIAHKNAGHPVNALANVPFRGINLILLQMAANQRGFWSKWWATQSGWKLRGCPVKPNGKGTEVCLREGERLRCETMFNAEQCQGADKSLVRDVGVNSNFSWYWADHAIARTGADIRLVSGSEAAYYRLPKDHIILPLKEQFEAGPFGLPGFYASAFHELIHWTEHRLGWVANTTLPVAPRYALGELRAELGACFLAGQLGVPYPNSLTHYSKFVRKWVKLMSADSTVIFEIAAAASEAVDFILSFSRGTQPETQWEWLVTA